MNEVNALGNRGTGAHVVSRLLTVRMPFTIAARAAAPLAQDLLLNTLEGSVMLKKIGRLFVIKTRVEAFLIIFALAMGATQRGSVYLEQYPGFGGWLLFLACTGAVFMAGAKILDCLDFEKAQRDRETSGAATATTPT